MNIDFVENIVHALLKGDTYNASLLLEAQLKKADTNKKIHIARRLRKLLAQVLRSPQIQGQSLHLGRASLLYDRHYSTVPIEDVVLNPSLKDKVVNFLESWEHEEVLRKNNLAPINKLLFYGPPGTGKTQLAYGIANKLDMPLLVVRLDELISSYLGKTGKNIREIFDLAQSEPVVLLLDEIDTIAKFRDDSSELGELKRVVTVLLQNIDNFPTKSILLGATNHEKLLDSALWRRFSLKFSFEIPQTNERRLLFKVFLEHYENVSSSIDFDVLAETTEGLSGSSIYDIALNAVRTATIKQTKVNTEIILEAVGRDIQHRNIKRKRDPLYKLADVLLKRNYPFPLIAEITQIPYSTLKDHYKTS